MTLIKKLVIENLRRIRKAEINDLGQVNIFIGRNGAGKSTILEAIYLASAWINPLYELKSDQRLLPNRKIDYIIYRRGSRGNWDSHRHFLWFSQDTKKPIIIDALFQSISEKAYLRFQLNYIDQTGSVWIDLKNSYVCLHGENVNLISLIKDLLFEEYVQELGTNPRVIHNLTTRYPLFNYFNKQIADYDMKSYPKISIEDIDIKSYREYLDHKLKHTIQYLNNIKFIDKLALVFIEKYEKIYWPHLLAKRLDKLLIEMLRKGLEEDIEGLTYIPINDDYVLVAQLSETSIRIDDLGEGARDALLIMMSILALEDTAVLLEEPEAHLHPGGLSLFLEYLLHVAKKRSLQLFISTHSIELVNMALRIGESENIDVKVFFVERDKNGYVSARVLNKLDIETLQKLGIDPRFLDII